MIIGCCRPGFRVASILLAFLAAGFVSVPAQPVSFFSVTNWRGTFTHRVTDQGQNARGNCTITWSVSHDVNIQSKLHLDSGTLEHPFFRYWFSTNNLQEQIQVHESYVESCPNPGGDPDIFQIISAPHPEFPPRGFDLSINTQDGTYSVGFPAGAFITAINSMGDGESAPIEVPASFPFDGEGGTITRPLPTNGVVLSGTSVVPMSQIMLGTAVPWFFISGFLTANLEVTWTLVPGNVEEVELLVAIPAHHTWIPNGSVDETTPGNHLAFTARLQQKGGGTPQARVKKFRVELDSVSREPGVCLNFPIISANAPSPAPDLQFLAVLNQDWQPVGGPEFLALESPEGEFLVSPEAQLTCFDWGAYGLLKVTAELTDGRTLVGHLETDPTQQQIRLPKRAAGSLIADAWKTEQGVTGLSDFADHENIPVGDGHTGDGLTLYEEYRGFYEDGPFNHLSGHPHKKDLFVRDRIGDSRGYLLAARLSGLEIHYKFTDAEFPPGRVINANHSAGAPHLVDQHGLVVVRSATVTGAGQACGGPSIPKFIDRIVISTDEKSADASGGIVWTKIERSGQRILRDRFARLIAHELMHGCNVPHHGGNDLGGEWLAERDAEGTVRFLESGQMIRIRRENGDPVIPRPLTNLTMTVWLGMPQSQHSGDENCVMRYDVADAYPSLTEPDVRYWIDGDEIAGAGLCAQALGTGINASGRQPQSRYGDAANGGCQLRICVNDAANHSPGQPCQ